MGLSIDHVGIVVRDVRTAVARFAGLLGLPDSALTVSTVTDPETGEAIDVGFLRIGENRIEFICPRPGSRSRFAEHLDRNGESLYHISVYVDEFGEAVDRLRGDGVAVDPLTVVMTSPAAVTEASVTEGAVTVAAAATVAPTRVVDIAWLPTELTCGVNVELVNAVARSGPAAGA
ncbi:MAG TPA: VOC family protein [Micromonosporaceae bacterium]